MEYNPDDNSDCIHPTDVPIGQGVNFFSQSVDPSRFDTSTAGCDGIGRELKGAWYMFRGSETEDLLVDAECDPTDASSYIPYMEVHKDCVSYKCEESSDNANMEFYVPKGLDTVRYLFVTSIKKTNDAFGPFRFWATTNDPIEGSSYENAVTIPSIPYGRVDYVFPETVYYTVCTETSQQVNSFWFSYVHPAQSAVVISTCGPETQFDSYVELIRYVSKDTFECVQKSKDVNCGGGEVISTTNGGSDKNETLNIVVTHDPDSYDVYGTFRLSVYDDTVHPESRCDQPLTLKSFPYEGYFYTMHQIESSGNCFGLQNGLQGIWYYVKASKASALTVRTDDTSSIATQVGIYKSCKIIEFVSEPSTCIDGSNSDTDPQGVRGTYIQYNMDANEAVLVFVGGEMPASSGIVHVKIDLLDRKPDNNGYNPTFLIGFYFWLIFGLAFIAIAILGGIAIIILFGVNRFRVSRL